MPLISEKNGGRLPLCVRCHDADAALVVRTEHLCSDCFRKYVETKALKRLETNKIRGGFKDSEKTHLVPVSFGVSSITLLHMLDQQLHKRAEQGRHAGYALHVLFVDQATTSEQESPQSLLKQLEQRYPCHSFTSISLRDMSSYGVNIEGEADAQGLGWEEHLSQLSSATSRADIIDIARRQLIFAFAKDRGYDSILFGDSTTRLAERTLSETAKGRGVTLPWLTADGSSVDGVHCIFPLRDLLRKELIAYASSVSPSLNSLILVPQSTPLTSSKATTIDDLMGQYFQSVEQNYPSIVANVVRTSGKLKALQAHGDMPSCSLCKYPILDGLWGGEQQCTESEVSTKIDTNKDRKHLCYGCSRSAIKD